MSTITNGQTCLEKRGIEERQIEIVRSDYNIENQYGPTHKDAISDGDPQGKGSGSGGHTDFLPDCNLPTSYINYSNFVTVEDGNHTIGGSYDRDGRNGIGGRNRALAKQLYNNENPYGANLIDTRISREQGQYFVK